MEFWCDHITLSICIIAYDFHYKSLFSKLILTLFIIDLVPFY